MTVQRLARSRDGAQREIEGHETAKKSEAEYVTKMCVIESLSTLSVITWNAGISRFTLCHAEWLMETFNQKVKWVVMSHLTDTFW